MSDQYSGDDDFGGLGEDDAIIPLGRLDRDLKAAAKTLTQNQARYFVDLYYTVQDDRIRAKNQVRAMDAAETPEPNELVEWFGGQTALLERNLRNALGSYAESSIRGQWALSQHGVGPVIAAGLLAHIDVNIATNPSKIWRFAGLDPTASWLGKEGAKKLVAEHFPEKREITQFEIADIAEAANRNPSRLWMQAQLDVQTGEMRAVTPDVLAAVLAKRPWNARLKVLCWKIGQSFVKFHGSEKCFYGHIYADRKALEISRNERGVFAEQAREKLATTQIGRSTDAYLWYSGSLTAEAAMKIRAETNLAKRQPMARKLAGKPGSGVEMLPPARIDLRAQRYATKLFLSHFWQVAYAEVKGEKPPRPWIIEHGGHADIIPVPGWPEALAAQAA